MKSKTTPESAMRFTKISVALICSWPPSSKSSKKEMLIFQIQQLLVFLNPLLLFLPLSYTLYIYGNDLSIVAKCLPLLGAVTQVIFKVIVCYFHRSNIQNILDELETFCRKANTKEYQLLQDYVDKRKFLHIAYTTCSYLTALFVICGPLYLPQKFPTIAIYPFPVEHQPLRTIVYMQQALAGFQASASLSCSCQIALLLGYLTARFDLLISEMQTIRCKQDLLYCIKKHIKILKYTEKVNVTVRLLIFSTLATTSIASIFGGIILVTKQAVMLKAMFCFVVFTASIELFISAWSADNLMYMSTQMAHGVYGSRWFNASANVQKNVINIIMRSQKPLTISIRGILPNLSLKYYTSFLYTIFSYYAALKVLIDKGKI